jgi:hypothetical protein
MQIDSRGIIRWIIRISFDRLLLFGQRIELALQIYERLLSPQQTLLPEIT